MNSVCQSARKGVLEDPQNLYSAIFKTEKGNPEKGEGKKRELVSHAQEQWGCHH